MDNTYSGKKQAGYFCAPEGCGAFCTAAVAGKLDLVTTMATTSDSSVSFEETGTRSNEMNTTIEQWIGENVASMEDGPAVS